MQLKFALFSLFFLPAFVAQAQFRGGVTTGLNFTRITGPSETDAAGNALETFDNLTGFFIGPSFSFPITDRFGLRGEALYSKRGVKYTYNGPSFRTFTLDNNQGSAFVTGSSQYQLVVNTHYIDVPVSAYVRLGNFEMHGGGFVSLLAQAVGDGTQRFTYQTPNQPETTIELKYRHNYRRDDVGEFVDNDQTFVAENINGRQSTMPSVVGAYYDAPSKSANLYNTLDYGVHAGLSYYLSRSLFAGVRFRYGLADLTNSAVDFAKLAPDANQVPTTRDDFDRSVTVEARVGFSF
jgi:hypothetical protein